MRFTPFRTTVFELYSGKHWSREFNNNNNNILIVVASFFDGRKSLLKKWN